MLTEQEQLSLVTELESNDFHEPLISSVVESFSEEPCMKFSDVDSFMNWVKDLERGVESEDN